MKAMKKALALGLALAMVVTAVPVTSAQAASTAKLSASKVSVAAGTAKKQTKSVKVTTPSTWKSVKVKASSSDKKIATVKVSGKTVKVTAVKKGSAKVTVKVSAKKSGKTVKKTLTAKVTVINAGLRFVDPATEVVVGESVTLTAKKSPKAAVVTFKSSDDKIATVDADGKVTAVKAGKVTITATSDYLTKEVTTDVTVKNVILKDVKQTKADTLEATIAGDTASLKADDVVIKNTANNIVYAVKSVTVDKTDKTKVTITTLAKMNDGKEYSVTLDGVTKTFTATDGKADAVKISPVTVPYATLSTISAIAVDVQGVVLDEVNYNNEANVTLAGKTAEFKITPAAGGYTNGAQLYLAKKDDTAKATVTIKSGEYDSTGKEINNVESGEVTITAVDQEVVTVSNYQVRISTETGKSFDEVKDNTTLAVGDQGYAYFKILNSKNEEAAYADYKISSSNPNVLVIAEVGLSKHASKKGSAQVSAYGVTAGTAYIIVKKGNDVVATLPVTVSPKRAVNVLTLDRTAFTLSTSTSVDAEVVKLIVKDQYNNDMVDNTDFTTKVELLASPSGATTASAPTATENHDGTVSFATASSNATIGKFTYKITVTDKNDGNVTRSQVVTVDVKAPSGAKGYTFELTGLDVSNAVDATLKDGVVPTPKEVYVRVVETLGGIKNGYVDIDNIVVKKDNKLVESFATDSGVSVATFTAIDVQANVVTAAAAGTYVVSGTTKDGKTTIAPTTFIVKNDTAKVIASQTKGTITAGTLTTVIGNSFDFNFGAKKLETADYSVLAVKATANGSATPVSTVTANDVVYITEVTLSVKVDGTNAFYVTVPVNKSVKAE